MNTLTYIRAKYNLKENQSQHRLRRSRVGSLSVLFKELGFNRGAEIGVETGKYSKCLLTVNPYLKLFAIDTKVELDNAYYNKAKNRLATFNARLVKDTSMDAVKRFKNESLDFVYINTFGDSKDAFDDISEWSKKVRKGGIVSGYGYSNKSHGQLLGFKKVVDKWVNNNKIRPLLVFENNDIPTWLYVKEKSA